MNDHSDVSRSPLAVAESLVPLLSEREARHDADGLYASGNVATLAENGLLALNVPREAGGFGAGLTETTEALRILAHAAPSTALMLAMHTSVLAHYLVDPELVPAGLRDGFEQQRTWAWSEATRGRTFGVANSEPGAAGDLRKSKARAERTAEGQVVLSGDKSFASFGTNAAYYMAAARDESDRVQLYLVRNDGATVTPRTEWDALGMRSSESIVLHFAAAPVVGPLAYPGLIDGVNHRHWSTLAFTAVTVGIAESLLTDIRAAGESLLQKSEAVEFHLMIEASRAFLRHAAAVAPAVPDDAYRRLVRDCKLFVSRTLAKQGAAVFVAQTGRAYQRGSSIGRKLRDLLAGPALRPPVGISFEEVWDDIA